MELNLSINLKIINRILFIFLVQYPDYRIINARAVNELVQK